MLIKFDRIKYLEDFYNMNNINKQEVKLDVDID